MQFIGGQAQAGSGQYQQQNNSAAPKQETQDYNVSTDSNFASDDIPF